MDKSYIYPRGRHAIDLLRNLWLKMVVENIRGQHPVVPPPNLASSQAKQMEQENQFSDL
jgi:hypothetical protein